MARTAGGSQVRTGSVIVVENWIEELKAKARRWAASKPASDSERHRHRETLEPCLRRPRRTQSCRLISSVSSKRAEEPEFSKCCAIASGISSRATSIEAAVPPTCGRAEADSHENPRALEDARAGQSGPIPWLRGRWMLRELRTRSIRGWIAAP